MKSVTPEYAAAHFAELIDEVMAGAEILIVMDGEPAARLVPATRGRGDDQDDPHAPSEEVEQAFHGD